MKKTILFVSVLVLICGFASAAGTAGATEGEPYTIQAYFPGDTPIDFDLVLEEAEKQAAADGINVDLEFIFFPWSDYADKIMTKMTAGEDFDLHLNAPWMHMQQLIASEAIQPWDDLIDMYGPNIKREFDESLIKYNSFDGKIMGIPLADRVGAYTFTTIYRGDLAKAVGMDSINSKAEMEEYWNRLRKQFPEIICLTWEASNHAGTLAYYEDGIPRTTYQFGQNNCFVQIPLGFDGKAQVDEILPIYEWEPFIRQVYKSREWYEAGIIEKDIMAQTDQKGLMNSGRHASGSDEVGNEPLLRAAAPGAYTVYQVQKYPDKKSVSDFKAWNFLCMNSKTKDPEIVTRWYDWIYADQANYDLLGLGIEGKHWVDKGNFTYDIPKGIDATQNYRFPGYVLIWNAKFIKTSAQWPEGYTALRAIEADGDNFVMSELAGFTADLSAVEDEVAMCSALFPELIFTLTAGVIEDTEAGLANAKKQLEAAGYLKVVAEAQRQVKEFLANK